MSHNEYTYDLYSANLVTIFNSINANDQQIDEELMQEFGSAHAAYQDVPEVVNTVHDNSSPVDLDIEDGMLIELGLHPVTTYVIVEPPFTPAPPRTPRTLVETVHATMQSPAALVSLPLLLPPPPPHAEASERFDKMQAWLKPRRAMRMLGHFVMASAGFDKTVRVWDATTGACISVANLVTIFNSINANDQQIDEELMQEFGSAHAAYQDVPEVVNTVHDNSSPVDLDIEDGMG
ncbi:hypothetical protein PPROV_000737800 [Pycnococcus provasolii]|uniref:Uncharacterized protein n=1 Tax=Pycnococcus provasolii TaxID=41880 RepID=A0A830HT34_9CHLO|nr:hypothetical protein PPROV_000737800 [Pycnococcus provasolii]